jgi:hypothetical protein
VQAFNTPILFLVFNRPETTKRVFEVIRNVKPKKFYIAADGPRLDKDGEKEKCDAVRKIATQVDWDCELITLFRDKNLGCGKAVSEAITWFFENVEEGIILEDDCVPDVTFFHYCSELLCKYRDNEKIMHIGANNFQKGIKRGSSDYYFSTIPHIWGWALWKRAWDKYDYEMRQYEAEKFVEILKKVYKNQYVINYLVNIFNLTAKHDIDTWDYQWHFTLLKFQGIAISPNKNLVTNIGFDFSATHTREENSLISYLPSYGLNNINHPKKIQISTKADLFTYKHIYGIVKPKNWAHKLYIPNKINRLKKMLLKFSYKIFKSMI